MKIKPIEPDAIATPTEKPAAPDEFEVTENDDGSVTFPLPDGTIVTLRDILTEDLLKMEQFALKEEALTSSAAIFRMIELICTKWGEGDKFDREGFLKSPFRKVKPSLRRLTFVLKEFFRLEDLLADR